MRQTLDAETQALRQLLHAEETPGHRTELQHQYLAQAATEPVASPRVGGRRCAGIGSLFILRKGEGQKSKSLQFIRTVDHHYFLLLSRRLIQKGCKRISKTHPRMMCPAVGWHASRRVMQPHVIRSSHASLTEVSPTSWCTNTVAFPRGGKATGQHSNSSGNRNAFADWHYGMLPTPWLLDRRSIVPCVLPTTSIIPFVFPSSPGPSLMFPRRTKFAKFVEPSGM